jgi:drug/metabolite transporter (DMT)-like permease
VHKHGYAFIILILTGVLKFGTAFTFQCRNQPSFLVPTQTRHISCHRGDHRNILRHRTSSLNVNALFDSQEEETIVAQVGSLKQSTLEASTSTPVNSSIVWKSRALIILAASLYGTNHSAIKMMEDNLPLEIGTALRFFLAAMITLPFLLLKKKGDSSTTSDDDKSNFAIQQNDVNVNFNSNGALLGGAEVGFWNFLGYTSQAIGLQSTPAGTNAFICSLAVVIVPILDFLVGKKILQREIIGAFIAVVGVAFLQVGGLLENNSSGEPIFTSDTVYSFIQPLAFGVAYWRMEYHARRHSDSGMQLTVSQLVTIAILMLGNLLFASGGLGGIPDWSQFATWFSNPTILQAVLWTGIVTTALTIFIETIALKNLSAAEVTMLYCFEPIFGSIVAAVVLSESLGANGVFGGALILGGCVYSSMGCDDENGSTSI